VYSMTTLSVCERKFAASRNSNLKIHKKAAFKENDNRKEDGSYQ